jgi:hypothetical protein
MGSLLYVRATGNGGNRGACLPVIFIKSFNFCNPQSNGETNCKLVAVHQGVVQTTGTSCIKLVWFVNVEELTRKCPIYKI